MDEGQLKEAAEAAWKLRLDDLAQMEEDLLSEGPLKDVLFLGLATAFEVGFVAGHKAGRAYAYVVAEKLAEAFMKE